MKIINNITSLFKEIGKADIAVSNHGMQVLSHELHSNGITAGWAAMLGLKDEPEDLVHAISKAVSEVCAIWGGGSGMQLDNAYHSGRKITTAAMIYNAYRAKGQDFDIEALVTQEIAKKTGDMRAQSASDMICKFLVNTLRDSTFDPADNIVKFKMHDIHFSADVGHAYLTPSIDSSEECCVSIKIDAGDGHCTLIGQEFGEILV